MLNFKARPSENLPTFGSWHISDRSYGVIQGDRLQEIASKGVWKIQNIPASGKEKTLPSRPTQHTTMWEIPGETLV